jgi:hypothetical protein
LKKNEIEILAAQLSRKRKNTTTFRVKPAECPINYKYCLIKTKNSIDNTEIQKFKCPYLESVGLGNELGVCVIKCSCTSNSVSYILGED